MLWTSSAFRRITDCFNDSRRPAALSLLDDADDGTSRRCQVAARPSNAESAQNRRLFTPVFAAAVCRSKTHIGAKCLHLSAFRYPRNACRISKSICQDAFTKPSVDKSPWHNEKMNRIFSNRSITYQITCGPTCRKHQFAPIILWHIPVPV